MPGLKTIPTKESKPAIRPTFGLALGGSGNRSSFYIGFLEVLDEQEIKIDYIAACSGGSLVAAAYACGTMPAFKEKILSLNNKNFKNYLARSKKGGLFSLDLVEQEIRDNFTKNLSFEDVRPLMGFAAVDIESGEKVLLCMGDIAKAAVISCTLPGIFEPSKWGGKTLVDGGLLTIIPGDILRGAGMDVTVGVKMQGNKYIFGKPQIRIKKAFNFLKKIFFAEEIESLFGNLFQFEENLEIERTPGIFQVLGKSLDLAIAANSPENEKNELCDLMITPLLPQLRLTEFPEGSAKYYYQMGRESAEEYMPKIKQLIKNKQKILEKV